MSDVVRRVEQTLQDEPEANIIAMHIDDVRALLSENERLRDVARTAFDAFEAHWSSAGGSPEEHAKFMQHRRRFYEFYEPFRAALAEGGEDG